MARARIDRRLISLAGILGFSLVASLAFAQGKVQTADVNKRGLSDKDFPHAVKLADNVYAFEMLAPQNAAAAAAATPQERYTTNSLVVITTDGVLIADGQGSPAQATRLMEEITKLTNQPIKYVVICTPHTDHTGGNSAFPSTATFIAHPTSKEMLEAQANAPNRAANAPKVVVPTETVSDKKVLKMGGTEIQVLFLGLSHSGGDLTVYLPKEKVLWMSETFNHRRFPTLGNGYPTEWVKAIDKAQKMDVQYYAGAHGFVDDAATQKVELGEYRKALEALIAETKRLYKPGASVDEAYKQANFGPYASWTTASAQAPTAFKRIWDELDGKLK